jgi:hypothetical protein
MAAIAEYERKHVDVWASLAAPFAEHEVKSFQKSSGTPEMFYITARTVMNRLDDILGPHNWTDDYEPCGHALKCFLTITLPDGTKVTKTGVGGKAGMGDEGDDEKSAESDAFKRAASKIGVGRYLRRDGVPVYAKELHKPEDREAVPKRAQGRAGGARGDDRSRRNDQGSERRGPPRTGGALFAWLKEQTETIGSDCVKYMNQWGKVRDFPNRIVDWDADQVAEGYAEMSRKIASKTSERRESEAAY